MFISNLEKAVAFVDSKGGVSENEPQAHTQVVPACTSVIQIAALSDLDYNF